MTVHDLFVEGKAGKLSVRIKAAADPKAPIAIFVQGANMSGQMGYDFSDPTVRNYSFLDATAQAGVTALTFSVRGYAKSDAPSDPFQVDTDAAIEDLASVVDWVLAQGHQKVHLVGWSWGGRITGRYVETQASNVDRLVLLDPALGGGNKVLPAPTNPWWDNTYDYFFERLEEEFTELALRQALGRNMAEFEPKSPNGIRMENAHGSIRVNAAKITVPTLMLYGSAAGQQNYMQGGLKRADFFEEIPNQEKALVIVPDCGDYAHLQKPRQKIFNIVNDFLIGRGSGGSA